MPPKKIDTSPVYQIKVSLMGSKPPIWRRLQLRGSTTLPELHIILQIAMGWMDAHLHQFIVDGVYYGVHMPDWDMDMEDESRLKLADCVANKGDRFVYEYDFGDGWEHLLLVEEVLTADAGTHYPVCLTGKRACPPEDVGGVWGYGDFLEAIGDPKNPEHEEMLDWVGYDFDPEDFELELVNKMLAFR